MKKEDMGVLRGPWGSWGSFGDLGGHSGLFGAPKGLRGRHHFHSIGGSKCAPV